MTLKVEGPTGLRPLLRKAKRPRGLEGRGLSGVRAGRLQIAVKPKGLQGRRASGLKGCRA